MFIPYKVDVPMQRWPVANWVLIGVISVVSVALFPALSEWEELAGGAATVRELLEMPVELPEPTGVLRYFLLFPGHAHPLQLVGHLFLHGGILHLVGNMLFLFVFGNAVNAKLGHGKYLLLFLGVGVLDGLAGLQLETLPSLGASGAIMGVVGAFLVLYPLNDISVVYWFSWFWRGATEISAGWVIAAYVAFDVWGMIFQQNAGIGYLAHVIGFGLGAGATALLLKWGTLDMDRDEKSLLQVLGWMPYDEEEEARPKPFRPLPARPAPPSGTHRPAGATAVAPPPRRVKRDDGPIPLE
jgi:membrane associated rhomboid family serine protease